ncbi:MAG: hypothetical protein ACXVJG_21455, partial [Mucilaginibacter sp.]
MMKRLILPGYLFFFLSICLCTEQAYSQDSTKKVEPEKKVVVKTATPPKAKPVYHSKKLAPTVPVATPANTDTAGQANSLKTQIDPAQLNDKSLNGQYQYLLTKTYHYQQPLIAALWKNMTDTLNLARRQLKDAQAKLAAQSQTVNSLKADATTKEQTLSESNAKADAISLFGILMTKATYNLVMFGLVVGLAIALIVVIITTAKYKHEARHRIELYDEIDEEYKAFKAKANEKEKKLAREL